MKASLASFNEHLDGSRAVQRRHIGCRRANKRRAWTHVTNGVTNSLVSQVFGHAKFVR